MRYLGVIQQPLRAIGNTSVYLSPDTETDSASLTQGVSGIGRAYRRRWLQRARLIGNDAGIPVFNIIAGSSTINISFPGPAGAAWFSV